MLTRNERTKDLNANSILALSPKISERKVLFDLLKEDFDHPSVSVDSVCKKTGQLEKMYFDSEVNNKLFGG